jgi:hypothetical protein
MGTGNDPQDAHLAIDELRGTVWHSDWYATPGFGNLYLGTGLIVDMGRPVTVTAVRVALGAARTRTPRSAWASSRSWRSWPPVGPSAGPGGAVRLTLASPPRDDPAPAPG